MTADGFKGIQVGPLNQRGGSIRAALRERPLQVVVITIACAVLAVLGIGLLALAVRNLVLFPEILGGAPVADHDWRYPGETILRIITAGLTLFGVLCLGTAVFVMRRFVTRWFASQRMAKFAEANGFTYQGDLPGPRYQAAVMQVRADDIDHHRVVTGQVGGGRIEFGDFEATKEVSNAGDSGTRNTVVVARYAYLAIDLGARAPHFVLDSVGDKRLYRGYAHFEKWDLEGDFPAHFTAWVEPGSERTMLELLTPDVMHVFSEFGQEFDYEVMGTLLVVVANRRSIGSPRVAEGMLRAADQIVPLIRQRALRANW